MLELTFTTKKSQRTESRANSLEIYIIKRYACCLPHPKINSQASANFSQNHKLNYFTYGDSQFRIKTVMRVLDSIIGWLAPPVCIACGHEGQTLCFICSQIEILPFGNKCWHCGSISSGTFACSIARRGDSPKSVWVVSDYESTAKKLITLYKFNHQRSAAMPIAAAMARTLLEFNSDKNLTLKNYLLIPVPTASGRLRQRGFDHTMLLSREIGFNLKMPIERRLFRSGQSRQVGSKRAERLRQLEAVFYVKNPKNIRGRNVLLIDDVITTGATINAAAKTLKAAGAKSVDALVFAKKL